MAGSTVEGLAQAHWGKVSAAHEEEEVVDTVLEVAVLKFPKLASGGKASGAAQGLRSLGDAGLEKAAADSTRETLVRGPQERASAGVAVHKSELLLMTNAGVAEVVGGNSEPQH